MRVHIEPTPEAMGRTAGERAAAILNDTLSRQAVARLVVATGASQFATLATLAAAEVDWSRVEVFHLDEYVGLDESHPASFRRYLRERFIDQVQPRAFFPIDPGKYPASAAVRLSDTIKAAPIDLALVGIGENGHLAFNDPPANFNPSEPYEVVMLDEACRAQQLGEGWFDTLDDVPRQAISMSVAHILTAQTILCSVPDERKANAVAASLGPVTVQVPASALQLHDDCTLLLDEAAASRLTAEQRAAADAGEAFCPLVDLQVNGYAGVDFNADDLTEDQFAHACDALAADGVPVFLPTLITDAPDKLAARLKRLATFIEKRDPELKHLPGIHLEGPFLNASPGFIGAHPAEHATRFDADLFNRLMEAGGGLVTLLTLAPEQLADGPEDGDGVRKRVEEVRRHVRIVAAGHTDASLRQLQAAVDGGLSLFTHYGNACPAMLPRHDNILARVMTLRDRLAVSLIGDGHHVPPATLRLWLEVFPRALFVSDAIAATGLPPGEHTLAGQPVHVDADGACWSADRTHFAGAATPLKDMLKHSSQPERHGCLTPLDMLFHGRLTAFSEMHVTRWS